MRVCDRDPTRSREGAADASPARMRRTLAASTWTAVVVGVILTLVNQWPSLTGHSRLTTDVAWRIAANFCVPFAVSLYSRWAAHASPRNASGEL